MRRSSRHILIPAILTILALAPFSTVSAEDTKAGLEALMPHYETIRLQLVEDVVESVPAAAESLRAELERLQTSLTPEAAGVSPEKLDEVAGLLPEAIAAARRLEGAGELEAARAALYDLTKPLVRWRQAAGDGPKVAYCPMKEQSWLQLEETELGNPYYGQRMASCGEIVDG